MKALKNLFQFRGELHDIYLLNFSVDAREIAGRLPSPIRPALHQGRALISMVDVHLRNMQPEKPRLPFKFHYQHVAFRLLIEDAQWNDDGREHGIFFLDSFTDRPFLAWAGNLFSEFQYQVGWIANYPSGLRLDAGNKFVEYQLVGPEQHMDDRLRNLQTRIRAIDRAWALVDNRLQKTQIVREHWPLEAMHCTQFETNFFETARFEGAFRVTEAIHYQWLRPEVVKTLSAEAMWNPSALSHA
ncbi:MAG: DUF2071 domain-containing protein [Bacteroidia bacterium]